MTMTLEAAARTETPAGSSFRMPWRTYAFLAVLALYVLLTLGIIYRTPVLTLDTAFYNLRLRQRWPGVYSAVDHYVMLGQRAPSTAVALPWIAWRAWRARSSRPIVMVLTALVVLNLSVGIVKTATARLGPLYGPNVHAIFTQRGNIFPSGHVSNAVVLYGILAWIAVTYRKSAIVAAVFISLTVGMGTVYLNTHWFSDVVGGWAAGGLVLLALPWLLPTAERWYAALTRPIVRWLRQRRDRRSQPAQPLDDRPESRRDDLVRTAPR